MESRIISYIGYEQVDISEYQKEFILDQDAVDQEMNFLKNKNATWVDSDVIENGAIVLCDLQSEHTFFNRENLKLMIGQNFFNKTLEELCIGLKKGETKELNIDDQIVTITVKTIQVKKASSVTNEMIEALGLEGIKTVQQYEDYLISKQRKKIVEDEGYTAIQYVMDQVHEKSEILLTKKDWKWMVGCELQRLQALADKENLNLKTMKPEDFDGKMPFTSYHELLAYLQDDCWERTFNYIIGRMYASEEGVAYSEEMYKKEIQEYMSFWRETEENAKKINTYEYSEVLFYAEYFYKKVYAYVEANYFKEEK